MSTAQVRTFSKTIDGEVLNVPAYNEADAVRYTFDGWREVTAEIAEAGRVAKQIAAAESGKDAKATTPK